MTITTAAVFDAATFPMRFARDNIQTWEIQGGAAVYLANMATLNQSAISEEQRNASTEVMATIEEVMAHNCRLPLAASQRALYDAMLNLVAEHGDALRNPSQFANRYANTVVKLVQAALKATVGETPYRLP